MKLTLLGLALSVPVLAQAPPPALRNPAFLEGAPGEIPKGWFFPKSGADAGFHAGIEEDPALPGGRCVAIRRETGSGAFGNLMQVVDAGPFRGKRIRLRTRMKVDPGTAGAGQAWLRVDREDGSMGFFDNMQDRAVTATAWTEGTIVGDVAPNAKTVNLGAFFVGGRGVLRVAPFTLEVLGDTPVVPAQPARALTERGLANLAAFTRAFGYIRFFHPSDAAASADWERLAILGARAAEGATSATDLASRLQKFFGPWAPTARFLPPGAAPAPVRAPSGATQAVRWVHTGFGQGAGHGVYHSERHYLPLAQAKAQGWEDPARGRVLALGAGVRLMLPTVCYADAGGATFRGPVTAVPRARMPEPTMGAGDGNDRGTRLGDVALAWGVFRHFYPYFDVAGGSWDAELPRALSAAALDPDAEAFTRTLRRLTAALQDGHIHVEGPGRDQACPALALEMIDGWPVVKAAGEGAKAVPAGSRILTVDGEPAGRRIKLLAEEISSASNGWLDRQVSREFLAGPHGQPARITYVTAGGVAGEASLPRDASPWNLPAGPLPPKVGELRPGIWYVDLDRATDPEFQAALPSLAAARGVIFDLRGYPKMRPGFLQHLTDKPLTSARWNKPVVTRPDGEGWAWDTGGRWDLEPKAPRIKGKVVFLTGGGAISYAESCLGIVEAYKLGEIVGAPTAGTNGNICGLTLPGGYHLAFTGMKVLKHDGTRHHGVGILPTVPVRPTPEGLAAGRDEVLEKGLALMAP